LKGGVVAVAVVSADRRCEIIDEEAAARSTEQDVALFEHDKREAEASRRLGRMMTPTRIAGERSCHY
jgi:hypothetical protein